MDKEKDMQIVKALRHMRLPKYEVIALKFVPKDKRDIKEFIGKEALIVHIMFGFSGVPFKVLNTSTAICVNFKLAAHINLH